MGTADGTGGTPAAAAGDEPGREPSWQVRPDGDRGVWGPDLFAHLYDFLIASDRWRAHPDPAELAESERVPRWRTRLRQHEGWVADALLEDMRTSAAAQPDERAVAGVLLEALVAIDRAFDGAALHVDRLRAPWMRPLHNLWAHQGSVERTAPGKVLRKGRQVRVGHALAHYCENLARLLPHHAERARITVAEHTSSLRWLAGRSSLRVAFAPTLDEPTDVEFEAHDDAHSRLFRIRLDPAKQDVLRTRLPELVQAWERRAVDLALLPETVVNADVLERLRAALGDNHARQVGADRRPHLKAVVVGVQREARRNDVVVLDARGRKLVTQPKMQPWTLDRGQQRRYGLDRVLGGVRRREDLEPEGTLHLLEMSGFGRAIALICEDVARSDPARQLAVASEPRVVFCPVMDGSLETGRWAYKAAEALSGEPGALTFVVNSCVLGCRAAMRDGGDGRVETGVGIVCHPDDWTETTVVTLVPGEAAFKVQEVGLR